MKNRLFLAAVIGTGAVQAAPVELDGRLSLRSLYSADAPNNPVTFISFLETDVRAERLTSSGLRLELDASFILDATQTNERRFGETERVDQVRNLYLEQPLMGKKLAVRVGRRIIPEAGNAWVDGLDLQFKLDSDRFTVGAYAGLGPDPFDRALSTDFQAVGTYLTLHRNGFDGALAANAVLRDGALDREFLFNRLHYKIADGLYVSSYLVADFARTPEITTLLATLDYSPSRMLNFTVNLTRYSIEQYRDQSVYRNVIEPNQALLLGDEVINLVYNRARFSASVQLWGSVYHYQTMEYKQRSQDGLDAYLYTIGIRDDNLMGWGTRVDLRTQLTNNFQSDSTLMALDAQHDLTSTLTLGGRLAWFDGRTIGRATERGRAFDEAQRIILIGGQLSWRAKAQHHLDFVYDGAGEAELQDRRNGQNLFIHTGMLRYSWLY